MVTNGDEGWEEARKSYEKEVASKSTCVPQLEWGNEGGKKRVKINQNTKQLNAKTGEGEGTEHYVQIMHILEDSQALLTMNHRNKCTL